MNHRERRRDFSWGFRASPLTCAVDGLAHVVTDDAAAAGIAARSGTYTAMCGHMVHATALICDTGSPCPRCALQVEARMASQVTPQTERRPGWQLRLRRLLGRGVSSVSRGS